MGFLKKINTDSLLWAGFCGMFFFLPVMTPPTAYCAVLIATVWFLSGRFLRDIPSFWNMEVALPMTVFVLLPWIGLLYAPQPAEGFGVAWKTRYWILPVAIIPVLSFRDRPDLLLKMFLSGLSLNSTIAILQYAGALHMEDFATGLLGGASPWISFSLLLTTGILIASFYAAKARAGKERVLYLTAILQYFITIGCVGGRSGYLALIILFPLMVYNIVGQKHMVRILLVSVVGISLLFAFPVVRDRISRAAEDIEMYKQGKIDTSLGLRFRMWGIALEEIESHPVIGMGTAGFRKAWEKHKGDPSLPFYDHPHNSFIYMMVSFGIPGLFSFCWLLFVMLKKGWRGRHSPIGFAVFVFTVVFIIGSMTDTELYPFAMSTALPLFVGLSEGADDES
jgi:O-antigen ligase